MTAPVALITGAARRVGRAIALELANAGFDIAIHYHRSREEAEQTVDAITQLNRSAIALQADLTDSASPARVVAECIGKCARLDVLVNNASIFEPDPDGGFDATHWTRMFQVNSIAPSAFIESAHEHLRAAKLGHVINLCDICADRPWKRYRAYCASKAALVNLTKSYAKQLAPDVCVNGVSPGIAVFPDDYDDAMRERLIAKVPLQRAGTPEDIARTVRFLVTDGNYITGQIINVDGGRGIV